MGAMTDTSHTRAPGTQPEETLGMLIADASRDLSALVQGEIALAKAELQLQAKTAATGGAMFGAAAYLGIIASLLLVITLALFLTWLGLEAWVAFLIVTVLLLLVAGVLVLLGKKKVKKVGPPERTLRTSKDTVAFLKSPTSS
jgi:hypothetical protein